MRGRRRFTLIGTAVLGVVAMAAPAGAVTTSAIAPTASPPSATSAPPKASDPASDPRSDVRELARKDFRLDGKPVSVPDRFSPRRSARLAPTAAAETPPVGTVRQWLGLDDFNGRLYRKD